MLVRVLLFSSVLLSACIDPYNTAVEEVENRYVIEGRITDREPPYAVTIARSSNYSRNIDGNIRYVSEAVVQICDDEGNCMPLYEMSKGHYETTSTAPKGIPGKSYHLEIVTKDGERIFSKPEKMPFCPPIQTAYAEYDLSTVQSEGFNVYIDTADPQEERNYYKWETVGFYKHSTECFYVVPDDEYPLVASDQDINGNLLSRIRVRNVYFNRQDTYLLHIFQFSLTDGAYEFYRRIKDQIGATGSIFDAPPAFIGGNLYNPDNENDVVLGYFIVSGSDTTHLIIDRNEITDLEPLPFAKPIVQSPCYCGDPCPPFCELSGCKCGNPPCPPECHFLPGLTSFTPEGWPLPHNPC